MFIIDQGETKLIKRTLLDENENPIPWNRVIDIKFALSIGGNPIKTYSKANEEVIEDGDDVAFIMSSSDTTTLPPTRYDLRVSIVVNDSRFNGVMTDTQWEHSFSSIRINTDSDAEYHPSINSGSIKFAVLAVDPDGGLQAPQEAPAVGTPTTTDSTMSIGFSSVVDATFYEYQIESSGTVQTFTSSNLIINLNGLGQNTTDRIRVRGVNSEGPGPWSGYVSYTTNPAISPEISSTTDLFSATFTITNPQGLDVEIRNESTWVNLGNITEHTRTNLLENQSYSSDFRYRNAGGGGPSVTENYTTQVRPQQAPTITNVSYSPGTATININLIAGITGVEYRLNAGTPVDVGLSSQFNVTPPITEQDYNLEVRYYNEWGSSVFWSEVTIINVPENIAPVVSNPAITISNRTASSYTLSFTKATDNKPDSELTYYLYEAGDPNDSADIADLGSADDIDFQDLVVQGVDVDTFEVTGLAQGYETAVNILVEDQAGNRAIYNVLENVSTLDPQVTAFNITNSDIEDEPGTTHQLNVNITTQDGADDTVLYESLNTSTATVDSNGLVTILTSLTSPDAIQVRAYSQFDNTQEDFITIQPVLVQSIPQVESRDVTDNSFRIVWNTIGFSGASSLRMEYHVYTGDLASLNDRSLIESQTLQAVVTDGNASYTLENLSPEFLVHYNVLIIDPVSGLEYLHQANSEITLEDQSVPEFLPTIDSQNIVESSLDVTIPYSQTTFSNPSESGYEYEITLQGGGTDIVNADNNKVSFSDLSWTHTPGDEWNIRVRAYNENGFGEWGNPEGWITNTYGSITATTTLTTTA